MLLRRALASVVSQSYEDYLHVIVNDGGNPDTVDQLVKEFYPSSNRLLVIHRPESHGMEAASNDGIQSCATDFVVIHDDDDSWHPEFLAETVSYLNESGAMGVITQCVMVYEHIVDDDVIIDKRETKRVPLPLPTLFEIMNYENQFPPISFIYRRAAFETIGYYDERLLVVGDWNFNIRFLAKWDIHVLQKPLAYYHIRPTKNNAAYNNSVVSGSDSHAYYMALMKNDMLRNDLESGRFGLGSYISISHGMWEALRLMHNRTASQVTEQIHSTPARGSTLYRICRKAFHAIPSARLKHRLAGLVKSFIGRA